MFQAYNDIDGELYIHKTELIDFTKGKNINGLQFLTRFSAASPVGNTTSEYQGQNKLEKGSLPEST